jgi:hypothetical protein
MGNRHTSKQLPRRVVNKNIQQWRRNIGRMSVHQPSTPSPVITHYQLPIDIINLLIAYIPCHMHETLYQVPQFANRQLIGRSLSPPGLYIDAIIRNDVKYCKSVNCELISQELTEQDDMLLSDTDLDMIINHEVLSPCAVIAIIYGRRRILGTIPKMKIGVSQPCSDCRNARIYDSLLMYKLSLAADAPNSRAIDWFWNQIEKSGDLSAVYYLIWDLVDWQEVNLLRWFSTKLFNPDKFPCVYTKRVNYLYLTVDIGHRYRPWFWHIQHASYEINEIFKEALKDSKRLTAKLLYV